MRGKVARAISRDDRAADRAVFKRARLLDPPANVRVRGDRPSLSFISSAIQSAWRALTAMLLGAGLAACATTGSPGSYMGIDLTSPAPASSVAAELKSLARRAQAGDKHAQLELGIRFEEGNGVERDLKRAKGLYRAAATDSGGTIWVYSPPVGNSPGRTIPINKGPKQLGLAKAKERLEGLE